jgi:branched-chain amino acid transport system substrate-binding protein
MEPHMPPTDHRREPKTSVNEVDRRSILKLASLSALAATGIPALASCTSHLRVDEPGAGSNGADKGRTIKIGYVSPQTGALAPFGEADAFVINQVRAALKANRGAGRLANPIEIIVRDSRSDAKRAGDAAADLILKDQVDLILASSTPDTTNPVADQCEANGVPCISTVAPWQPYFFGRGGKPDKPFTWTYHFFWGLEDIQSVFQDMWSQVSSNKKLGALWPNDPDGNAWGDRKTGFPHAVGPNGYTIVDPGHYANGTQDFTAQISRFKSAHTELLAGVPIPPDFIVFWKQAAQQGFQPKLATISKALLFPSAVEALGDLGHNLGTEVWWSPRHPFTSSLTGQSAGELATAYTKATKKPWTQPVGFVHALFEVAVAALSKAQGPDKKGIAEALSTLRLNTVVGMLDWNRGPVPNVAKTPLVGGQWRKTGTKYELVIVSNADHPEIPAAGKVQVLR